MPTLTMPLLGRILRDESLTRGLGDEEARILVEWMVDFAERLADDSVSDRHADEQIRKLCRRGRAIARFVQLWSAPRSRGAAAQLAAAEHFQWPLPCPEADPCEVMQAILVWEGSQEK